MNSESIKNSHCSYCGTRFTEQKLWPRKCFVCYNDSWSNPLPVVVILQPVRRRVSLWDCQYGLLIQQRAIDPEKGKWALTGGYIDDGETWQEAAVRECREEMGLEIKESSLELFDVTSSTKKNNILIGCVNRIPQSWEPTLPNEEGLREHFLEMKTFPNSEVLAVDVMWQEQELAFPAHTEWANRYIKELRNKR